MTWNHFIYFAVVAVLLWAAGAWAAWRERRTLASSLTVTGLAVFFAYIMLMWHSLERPPLRTMGETRLWYSLFLPLAGLIVYARWRYKWILSFSTLLSLVFVCVNLLKPEIHSKALMPALQSPWFAPHVIVYMFAYALLGAATLMAVYLLYKELKNGKIEELKSSAPTGKNFNPSTLQSFNSSLDNLVYAGLAFLTVGMLFGALWAKEAWGHYWSCDPKETWAAVTWFAYLGYIHYRLLPRHRRSVSLWLLVVAFLLLQVTWWGINYLPSAQGSSVHTYSS